MNDIDSILLLFFLFESLNNNIIIWLTKALDSIDFSLVHKYSLVTNKKLVIYFHAILLFLVYIYIYILMYIYIYIDMGLK